MHYTGAVALSSVFGGEHFQRLRLIGEADNIATLRGEQLQCLRVGDVRIERLRSSGRGDTIRVLCRPIAGIRFQGTPPLTLNGGPRRLVLVAEDRAGTLVNDLSGNVVIDDSTVIRMAGDTIFPKRVGATWIRVDVGDCSKRMLISVRDTVTSSLSVTPLREFSRSITLVANEHLALPLPSGWIGITLSSAAAATKAPPLSLTTYGANCTKRSSAPNDLACIVDSSAVALVSAGREAADGTVYIRTLGPDSISAPEPSDQIVRGVRADSTCPWIIR